MRVHAAELGATALAALAAVLLAWASLYRHSRFGSNAYDLGLFDQTIWGYSRLELLPNTVVRLPNLLGDHFHPILMALAPLYWVWDDVRVLLVAQATLLALSGIPLFLWARSELGVAAALLFEVAYLAFWALIGGSLFDFHELAVAAPILSLALYAALTRRTGLLIAAVVLGLLTREDLALTLAAIGVWVAIAERRYRLGFGVAAACVVWFGVMIKLVIPELAEGDYSHWWYTALGAGPASALAHLVLHPVDSARIFFTPREKQIALFNLFAPWLFLPLASPLVLVALPGLAARFFSDKPSHWAAQGFHYSLVLAPVLAFAAVDTTARIARTLHGRARVFVPPALAILMVVAGAYFSFGRLRPLDELRRLTPSERAADIRACLNDISPDASVAATSALVPHLSHRREIYVLDDRPIPSADLYALDLSTWTFPFTVDDAAALVSRKFRGGYGVACSRGSTAVLARGGRTRHVSPELERLLGR
jgi:uncharacterized membrane protein